jgi:hypothetical protein
MAKSSKPDAPIVLPEIHLHLDIPGELAVISAATNPGAALGDLLGRLAQSMFANGYAVGAAAMAEAAARCLPKLKKLRGASPVAVTMKMPAELTAALVRLAEPGPAAAAPVVNVSVSPTPVTIDNHVEVPSRRVIARQLGDGVVEMTPQ